MVYFFLGSFVILATVKDFHDYLPSSSIKKRNEYLSCSSNKLRKYIPIKKWIRQKISGK